MSESALREQLETQGVTLDVSARETIAAPVRQPEAAVQLAALRLRDRGAPPTESGAELEVDTTLGRGGMGVVQLARQPALRRDVAVKRLRDTSPHAVSRLLREAQITGRLEHPNIVPVHALGLDAEGQPVVVMKRVSGESWLALIRDGETAIERHVEIAIAVCSALHYAHEHGVVHRDVKPENVMVGAFDEVYLLDWGVALDRDDPRARDERGVVGTPSYMAPEMLTADPASVDERTDVYLLGASLHHALTGAPRRGAASHVLAVLHGAAVSARHDFGDAVPSELAALVNRACDRDPGARHSSALALRDALKAFLDHRAARELAQVGRARAAELEALLEGAPAVAPEPPEVRVAYDEAAFAFRQALRVHDDPSVRDALRATAERLFDHRIARRDVGGAFALVDALDPGDAARRDALEELRAEEAARGERLAWLERERDPRVGRTARVAFAALVSIVCLGFGLYALSTRPSGGALAARVIGFVAAPAVVLSTLAYVFRRQLLGNELSRSMVLTGLLAICAILFNRVVSIWVMAEPFGSWVLLGDQAILTVAIATLVLRARWTALALVPLLIGWVWMAADPAHRVAIFVVSCGAVPAAVAFAWWRTGREDERPPQRPS